MQHGFVTVRSALFKPSRHKALLTGTPADQAGWGFRLAPRMADKYHVVTQQPDPNWWRWEWEIFRNGKPLPVRLRGGNHPSKNSAERAGTRALREFLVDLGREQNTD